MSRKIVWPLRAVLLIAGASVCLVILLNVSADPEPAQAVPHTISATDHPYDPDWPDVYLILTNKCTGCHRPGSEQTDLSSYEALMAAKDYDKEPIVKPGRARDSFLWQQVAWNVTAELDSNLASRPEMPPDHHEWLSAGQLEILERWINRGALEYKLPDTCSSDVLTEMDFPSARQCAACHPKQYDEWSRSMHHYAQHSPVFEAFNLTLTERTGGTLGTFCSRCHTPIGTMLGENGSRRNVHRSRISMEGVTCIACHRRSTKHYKASGRVPVQPGKLTEGCMYGPFDDPALGPEKGTHASSGHPYLKTSQFCGECHDVINPQGVRLEEAFSEWQNSPAAKDRVSCQQCHMGPIQGVAVPEDCRPLGYAAQLPCGKQEKLPLRRLTDHTFSGPDYSLLPDTEFPHKLDWMYECDYRDPSKLTPYQQKSLANLRQRNRKHLELADRKRYELLGNAAKMTVTAPSTAVAGRLMPIRVDVTSKVSGHSVPTGFTAERQMWVWIEVRDPQGEVVFVSGDFDSNHDLRDSHSHDVLTGKLKADHFLLNFQNRFIALTNKGTDRSVILSVNRHLQPVNVLRPAVGISASFGRPASFRIAKGSLPPLATIGRTYPVILPDCAGMYQLRTQLIFRHLPPNLLDHVGTPHLKHLLEGVVIDQHEQLISVGN